MTWTPAMQAELAVLVHRAMPRRDMRERLSVYHCPHCHQWHIGTTFGPKQSVEAKRRKREEMEHERDY